MTLTIEIQMDNAAFEGDSAHDEAARILHEAACKIEDGTWNFVVRDINGNTVGTAKVTK